MKHANSDIDDKIRQALAEDDQLLDFDELGEQNIFEMLVGIFRGRLWWLNLLIWIFQLIFIGVAVRAAWSFFEASEVRDQILFATVFLWSVGVIGMFKMWFWMAMNRNTILRELKRLELQVARLTQG